MMRKSGMPAAFMASSSKVSPKLPKVMSEASSKPSGSACGTSVMPIYQKNCARMSTDRPLPISSST